MRAAAYSSLVAWPITLLNQLEQPAAAAAYTAPLAAEAAVLAAALQSQQQTTDHHHQQQQTTDSDVILALEAHKSAVAAAEQLAAAAIAHEHANRRQFLAAAAASRGGGSSCGSSSVVQREEAALRHKMARVLPQQLAAAAAGSTAWNTGALLLLWEPDGSSSSSSAAAAVLQGHEAYARMFADISNRWGSSAVAAAAAAGSVATVGEVTGNLDSCSHTLPKSGEAPAMQQALHDVTTAQQQQQHQQQQAQMPPVYQPYLQQLQHPLHGIASKLEDSPLPVVLGPNQNLPGPALPAAVLNPTGSAQEGSGGGVLAAGTDNAEYQQCKQVSHIIPRSALKNLAPLRRRDARQVCIMQLQMQLQCFSNMQLQLSKRCRFCTGSPA